MEKEREMLRETMNRVLNGELAVNPALAVQKAGFTSAYSLHAECRQAETISNGKLVKELKEAREKNG